jgi:hypothetical protein
LRSSWLHSILNSIVYPGIFSRQDGKVICINDHCFIQNQTTSSHVIYCINRCLLSLDKIFTEVESWSQFLRNTKNYFASRHKPGTRGKRRWTGRGQSGRQMQDRKTGYNAGQNGRGRAIRKSYAGQADRRGAVRQMLDREETNGGQTDKRRLECQIDAEGVGRRRACKQTPT